MKTAKDIICDALARKQITVKEFKKAIARLEAKNEVCCKKCRANI